MDDNLQNIDKYYSEKLVGYKADINTRVWSKLKWILFWDRYKYWLLSGLVVLVIGAGYGLYNGFSDSSQHAFTHQNEIITDNHNTYKKAQGSVEKEVSAEEIIDNLSRVENNSPKETIKKVNVPPIEPYNAQPQEKEEILNKEVDTEEVEQNKNETVEPYADTRVLHYQNSIVGRFNANGITKTENSTLIEFLNVESAKRKRKGMFSASIFAGPSLSDFILSGDNEEYVNYRRDNESSKLSWTAGARLNYHLHNFIITTGIEYSVYNQRRSYSRTSKVYSPNDSYYNYDTTWVWVFDPPDTGVPIISEIDSIWVKVYNDQKIENNGMNRLNYLEIPLLVGYQVNHSSFTFEISGGLGFGFLLDQNITIPSSSNDSTFIVVNNLRKNNINLMINGSIYYHVSRKSSLFISPYYKRGLVSIYNSDYPISQKPNSFGINFGINFRF